MVEYAIKIMNKVFKLLFKITQKYYYIWLEGSLLLLWDGYFIPSLFRFLAPLSSLPLMMPSLYCDKYSKADIVNTSVKPYPSTFMSSLPSSLPQRNPTVMRWILPPPPIAFSPEAISSYFLDLSWSMLPQHDLLWLHILLCFPFSPYLFHYLPSQLSLNLLKSSFCFHQIYKRCFCRSLK